MNDRWSIIQAMISKTRQVRELKKGLACLREKNERADKTNQILIDNNNLLIAENAVLRGEK